MQGLPRHGQESGHHQFPLGVYLLGALGVLSAHWFSLHLFGLLAGPGGWEQDSGQLTLLCAPLALSLGWLLWQLHHRFSRNRTIGQSLGYYTCAFALVAAAGWLAVASERWLLHGPWHLNNHPWAFAMSAAGVLALSWIFRLCSRICG